MFQLRWFVTGLLVVVALAGAAVARAEGPVTFDLVAQNDSGETGTATLIDMGNGKVMVEVSITGAPAGVVQPMHIHKGTCENLEAKPTYPLTSLTDGKSVTEIEATLAELQNGNFAINGHKSAEEASVYVFCGNIPAAVATTLPATGGDFASTAWLVALFGMALLAAGLGIARFVPRAR